MPRVNSTRLIFASLSCTVALAMGPLTALASERVQADDQCVEQCDAKADECMSEAGGDAAKQKQCDTKYEECEKKCG